MESLIKNITSFKRSTDVREANSHKENYDMVNNANRISENKYTSDEKLVDKDQLIIKKEISKMRGKE